MERKGLSGSTLKLIAVITMIIDHIGAAILGRLLYVEGIGGLNGTDTEAVTRWLMEHAALYGTYSVLRVIGRIAFPIFCFLLIEGFEHTKDRKKYALRLGLFALISEIPFDLAFNSKVLEFGYQNVFFTLFIGLITITVFHAIEERDDWNRALSIVLRIAAAFLGMAAAHFLCTDYAEKGIMCIVILYLFRKNKKWQILAGCLAFFWWELPALLAFIPIALYNGTRGLRLKYAFYLVYPVHLLILYLICVAMGISATPAI